MTRVPRPRFRSPRLTGGVALLGVAALALSGCANSTTSALRVGDATISRSEFTDDLKVYEKALMASAPTAADKASLAERIHTKADGGEAWSPDYSSFVLSHRLRSLAIDQLYRKSGNSKLAVNKTTRSQVEQNWGGAKAFATFSKDIQDRELRFLGQYDALVASNLKKLGTAEEFFKANPDQFAGEVCSRHILVASEDEAKKIRAEIVAGADFADMAKKNSTDPGTGPNGGDLGCGDPSQFVAEFAQAVNTLKLNELSQPVKTQFGYHLVEVTKRTKSTFDAAKTQISAKMQAKAENDVQVGLIAVAKDSAVDPAFGTIQNDQSGFPTVIAPTTDAAAVPAAS